MELFCLLIVGTVALIPVAKDKCFELTKMAVSPEYRGNKIGQIILKNCIRKQYDSYYLSKKLQLSLLNTNELITITKINETE